MNPPILFATATVPLSKFASQVPLGRSLFLIALALACFCVSPGSQAVSPAPDGGYPNANTAEGDFALYSLTTGFENTAIGYLSLFSVTNGGFNTAVGYEALYHNMAGNNIAVGYLSLFYNTTGGQNTAVGGLALYTNTAGSNNTGIGWRALEGVGNSGTTSGSQNTATGAYALQYNIGNNNTATGYQTLSGNGGDYNTATGYQALEGNQGGSYNTATGFASLPANTDGVFNTADGVFALFTNNDGYHNTASGVSALYNNTTGHDNTAVGYQSLGGNAAGSNNVGIGVNAGINVTGNNNIAIGSSAGSNLTTGSNNIIIGTNLLGNSTDASVTRIGSTTQKKTFIGGIYNKTVANGVGVIVNSSGQLGTVQSSARYKDDIKPMGKASEGILALKPVTFRYKDELDPDKIPQFGLIAEEVDKVNPDLVVRDGDGKVMTVRYEAVNAMLLNEFLKEHRHVEEQAGEIEQMKKQMQALTATVRKVSDQIEVDHSRSQTLVSNESR